MARIVALDSAGGKEAVFDPPQCLPMSRRRTGVTKRAGVGLRKDPGLKPVRHAPLARSAGGVRLGGLMERR
jgi:hypothetical protein